jgi:hypothetical protein
VETEILKKEIGNTPNPIELIAAGTINVLAMGYRGIEMWRKHRKPIIINEEKQKDEKEA